MNRKHFQKGIIFTIDGLLALAFIGLLVIVLQAHDIENNMEKHQINTLIGDILVTSQELSIDNLSELEANYRMLLGDKKGYIVINNNKVEINIDDFKKTKLISQRINYINISNYEIYIEIGVYY